MGFLLGVFAWVFLRISADFFKYAAKRSGTMLRGPELKKWKK